MTVLMYKDLSAMKAESKVYNLPRTEAWRRLLANVLSQYLFPTLHGIKLAETNLLTLVTNPKPGGTVLAVLPVMTSVTSLTRSSVHLMRALRTLLRRRDTTVVMGTNTMVTDSPANAGTT